jgi:hypothetical protein
VRWVLYLKGLGVWSGAFSPPGASARYIGFGALFHRDPEVERAAREYPEAGGPWPGTPCRSTMAGSAEDADAEILNPGDGEAIAPGPGPGEAGTGGPARTPSGGATGSTGVTVPVGGEIGTQAPAGIQVGGNSGNPTGGVATVSAGGDSGSPTERQAAGDVLKSQGGGMSTGIPLGTLRRPRVGMAVPPSRGLPPLWRSTSERPGLPGSIGGRSQRPTSRQRHANTFWHA